MVATTILANCGKERVVVLLGDMFSALAKDNDIFSVSKNSTKRD